MREHHIIGILLFLVALMPFAKVFMNDASRAQTITATGNAISAASTQYMSFMLNKNQLFNYFMNHYTNGFFEFQGESNYLYSTYITLNSMNELGNINELSPVAQSEILRAAQNYYDENMNADWFSPTYSYSYYEINTILGAKIPQSNMQSLQSNVLRFKMNNSIFSSVINTPQPNLEETMYALQLLSNLNYDLTPLKKDIINYINTQRAYTEDQTYYITQIAKSIGEQSQVPRTTLIGCVIKQYIPFVSSDSCALLLKQQNVLTYFPSALLLIASYAMLTFRRKR